MARIQATTRGVLSLSSSLVRFVLLSAGFLVACTLQPAIDLNSPQYGEWRIYHGDKEGNQYSALDQINVENVHQLEVAWMFSTGDLTDRNSQMQCSPIIIDGLLYCTSPQTKALALKADTGELLWMYDPFERMEEHAPGTNRGVVYWDDAGTDRRILFVAGRMLHAVDAVTGKPIEAFGQGGMVDLKQGLGRDVTDLYLTASSPGIIYRDLLIQGTRVAERLPAAPGHIRAYNVRTGELEWIFHTIPHPGEYGYETWPTEAYTYIGGANNWAGMSLDEKRGIVFVPTGSASFDFWGGNRLGKNLFANSLIALDAATGKRIWHYQTIRHDIFDYDLATPPNLVSVRRNGSMVDAVAQVTKTGLVFLFDRETGEPLFPIRERQVPPSTLIGEEAWPTQPVPVRPLPFARQGFTEDMITDISPESHAAVRERFRQLRAAGLFTPPSLEGTIFLPGFHGGAGWGGAAFDPETGILYVNSTEMPWTMTMVGIPPEDVAPASRGRHIYTLNCASCHGVDLAGDARGGFPSLENVSREFDREEVITIVDSGRGFMPSFAHISEADKEALIYFLMNPDVDHAPAEAPVHVDPDDPAKVPYGHTGYRRFFDPDGYPAVKPPWGTLNAIDLNTGEYVWKIPLGEFKELSAAGIPQTGTENYGGPVVTAGGLLLIAATRDEKFRAFDKGTGALLWQTDLPAGGYATPATYEVNGKQFIVIAAGGGKMGTKSGDTYVAFALPD